MKSRICLAIRSDYVGDRVGLGLRQSLVFEGTHMLSKRRKTGDTISW